MSRIRCMITKEFQQLRRDRRMRPILIIAPVMQILILGYAADTEVRDVPLAIYDQDSSQQSRALAQAFVSSRSFLVADRSSSFGEMEAAITGGHSEIGLVIPPSFGADLESGRGAQIQLLVDGTRSNTATVAMAYATATATSFAQRLIASATTIGAAGPAVEARTRVWYNPDLKSRRFMIPGVFALLIMVFTVILTSLAIVKEKEIGTLEQLIVTPLARHELIIGKLAPFVIISLVIITLTLGASWLFFGIVPRGSLGLLYALSLALVLSTLGMGLLVSTISRNQQQAMMFSIFLFMFPMMILSGFVFPIENMPAPIRALTYLMPLRYYLIIIRGIFLKGSDLSVLWPQLLPLLGIGTAVIGISIARFHKQLD